MRPILAPLLVAAACLFANAALAQDGPMRRSSPDIGDSRYDDDVMPDEDDAIAGRSTRAYPDDMKDQERRPPGGPRPGGPRRMGPPPPSKAATFHIENGSFKFDIKCADEEPLQVCADTAVRLLNEAKSLPMR